MKRVFYASSLVAMIVSFSSNADSFVRVKCDDQDVGAEIYLNGKFVGSCPVDVPAPEGIVELRARKIVDDDNEQLFETKLRIVDGVAQRVDIIMSEPQLTTEAKLRKDAAEASAQLSAAEAGNIAAMQMIAGYYDAGLGVEKNPSKAKIWREKAVAAAQAQREKAEAAAQVQREKAEAAAAQQQLRAANAGDTQAMEDIAARYDAGRGLDKDPTQAQAWRVKRHDKLAQEEEDKRQKIVLEEEDKRQKIAQERAQEKQAKIDSINFLQNVKNIADENIFTCLTLWPIPLLSDLSAAPFKSTDLYEIKHEAAILPSTWGKPDSMIARASQQLKTSSSTIKQPPLLADNK